MCDLVIQNPRYHGINRGQVHPAVMHVPVYLPVPLEYEDRIGDAVVVGIAVEMVYPEEIVWDYSPPLSKKFDIDTDNLKTKTVKAKSAVKAILSEARNYDLIVLGTTEKPILALMGRMSIPEKIACRAPQPVVMVKSNVGVRSWIKRWI